MLTTGAVSRPIDQVLPPAKSSAAEAFDACSDTTASGVASSEPSSLPSSPSDIVTTSVPAGLPSLGSLGHYAGQCSRCCFHPKGRCLNGYDCRFCHFDHDKRKRKKTRPLFGERSQVLPSTMEHAIRPCTPPGLEAYSNQPAMHAGVMQDSLPSASYAISPGLAMQPFGYEGIPQSQSQEMPYTAPEYLSVAPPSWPAPSYPSNPVEFQASQLWTVERVSEWLVSVGLGHLKDAFQGHRISGDVLLDLSQTDLAEMGVQALGDRKRILRAIDLLRGSH